MSDSITGYGITDIEFKENNEVLLLGAINELVKERRENTRFIKCRLGDIVCDGTSFIIENESFPFCEHVSTYMNLPSKYISSCKPSLRAQNMQYWLDKMADKDISLTVEDGEIISADDPSRPDVTIEDLLFAVEKRMMPIASVYSVENNRSTTVIDICNHNMIEFKFGGGWQGGIRISQKRTANKDSYAPVITPYLRSIESSASISFPKIDDIDIRGRNKEDILKQVDKIVDSCMGMLSERASDFRELWDAEVEYPYLVAKRVMSEHKISNRGMSNVLDFLKSYAETHEHISIGDMVHIISSHEMDENVQFAVRKGLSESAGVYLIGEAEKRRCPSCHRSLDE